MPDPIPFKEILQQRIANAEVSYPEIFLSPATQALGDMCEVAVSMLGYPLDLFFGIFLSTQYCRDFEAGDPTAYISRTGADLAMCVEGAVRGRLVVRDFGNDRFDRRNAYWVGWALAWYQCYSRERFADIVKHIPILEIWLMYWPYHEMDISAFCTEMDRRLASRRNGESLPPYELIDRAAEEHVLPEYSARFTPIVRESTQTESRYP